MKNKKNTKYRNVDNNDKQLPLIIRLMIIIGLIIGLIVIIVCSSAGYDRWIGMPRG